MNTRTEAENYEMKKALELIDICEKNDKVVVAFNINIMDYDKDGLNGKDIVRILNSLYLRSAIKCIALTSLPRGRHKFLANNLQEQGVPFDEINNMDNYDVLIDADKDISQEIRILSLVLQYFIIFE